MNNITLQDIANYGVLQWNCSEDITDLEEKGDDSVENDKNNISVLEQIFPPREWITDSDKHRTKKWRQTISNEMPTRSGVTMMIKVLRDCEVYYKIKSKGICETRSAIYNLYFDEILRQVIIVEEDLGSILYRVRNEFKNMVFVSKLLFKNAMLRADTYSNLPSNESELINEIDNLMVMNNDLGIKCVLSSQNYSYMLKKKQSREEENHVSREEESHLKQMSFLRRSIDQLKEQMTIMTPPKDITT